MMPLDLPATLRAAAVGVGLWALLCAAVVALVFGAWVKRWGHH